MLNVLRVVLAIFSEISSEIFPGFDLVLVAWVSGRLDRRRRIRSRIHRRTRRIHRRRRRRRHSRARRRSVRSRYHAAGSHRI